MASPVGRPSNSDSHSTTPRWARMTMETIATTTSIAAGAKSREGRVRGLVAAIGMVDARSDPFPGSPLKVGECLFPARLDDLHHVLARGHRLGMGAEPLDGQRLALAAALLDLGQVLRR